MKQWSLLNMNFQVDLSEKLDLGSKRDDLAVNLMQAKLTEVIKPILHCQVRDALRAAVERVILLIQ